MWLVPAKKHCLVVVDGSEGEEAAGRWSRASGRRGGPLACGSYTCLVSFLVPHPAVCHLQYEKEANAFSYFV